MSFDGEDTMKVNKISVLLLSLLIAAGIYLLLTSIERVPAGEVKIVREITTDGISLAIKPRPLVNIGDRPKWFFKQPKLPFLGMGFLEETIIPGETADFTSSFAYYTLDELTGLDKDRETVSACLVEGSVAEITDWELFTSRLNPSQYNNEDNPYGKKYDSRLDILAEQIKYLVLAGEAGSIIPVADESEKTVVSPGRKIDYWYQELLSRRNFIVALHDRYGFKEPEEYIAFLQNENPWYWSLGIGQYEMLLNQADDLFEYMQSRYTQGLTVRGYSGRYLSDEDAILLLNMIGRTDRWELSMLETEQNIVEIRKQTEAFAVKTKTRTEELADLLAGGYIRDLAERRLNITEMQLEELNADFLLYIQEKVHPELVEAIRDEKLKLLVENLAGYKKKVIDTRELDDKQIQDVERAVEYLKTEYAEYLTSDNWESFSPTFMNELGMFFNAHPEITVPDDEVIETVYFRLFSYYLSGLTSGTEKPGKELSDFTLSLVPEFLARADIMNSGRSDTSEIVYAYLISNDYILTKNAGTLVSLEWSLKHNMEQQQRLKLQKEQILTPFFTEFIEKDQLAESRSLWEAAINDVLHGPDLSGYREYVLHQASSGETLQDIAELYGISGEEIIRHSRMTVVFESSNDQEFYNYLNSFRTEPDVYELTKHFPLKPSSQIAVELQLPYSRGWKEKRLAEQKQRERLIKNYIYPWIDENLPTAFDDYIEHSPHIEELEALYGIKLTGLKLRVEQRSIFSNPRIKQVDPDFLTLYNSRL